MSVRLVATAMGLVVGALLMVSGHSALAAPPVPSPIVVGATTLSNITVNGVAITKRAIVSVSPGAPVDIAANWADNNTGCPTCNDFVDVGFQGYLGAAGCIESNSGNGGSSFGSATLTAPTTAGTYNVVASFESFAQQSNCGSGWDGTGTTIVQLVVKRH